MTPHRTPHRRCEVKKKSIAYEAGSETCGHRNITRLEAWPLASRPRMPTIAKRSRHTYFTFCCSGCLQRLGIHSGKRSLENACLLSCLFFWFHINHNSLPGANFTHSFTSPMYVSYLPGNINIFIAKLPNNIHCS